MSTPLRRSSSLALRVNSSSDSPPQKDDSPPHQKASTTSSEASFSIVVLNPRRSSETIQVAARPQTPVEEHQKPDVAKMNQDKGKQREQTQDEPMEVDSKEQEQKQEESLQKDSQQQDPKPEMADETTSKDGDMVEIFRGILKAGYKDKPLPYTLPNEKTILIDQLVYNMASLITDPSSATASGELDVVHYKKSEVEGVEPKQHGAEEVLEIQAMRSSNVTNIGFQNFEVIVFDPIPWVGDHAHVIGAVKEWVEKAQKRNAHFYLEKGGEFEEIFADVACGEDVVRALLVYVAGMSGRECSHCQRQRLAGKKKLVGCVTLAGVANECCANCLLEGRDKTRGCNRMSQAGPSAA